MKAKKSITTKNSDGKVVTFTVGQEVEFKYGVEQDGIIIDIDGVRNEVLVDNADYNGSEHGRPTWIECARIWND